MIPTSRVGILEANPLKRKPVAMKCERCASNQREARQFVYGSTDYQLCEECFYETVYENVNWHSALSRFMSMTVSPDPTVPW